MPYDQSPTPTTSDRDLRVQDLPTSDPALLVPEGDLPPGVRPEPGPSPARQLWTGTAAAPVPTLPLPEWAEQTEPARPRIRLVGLDAARGFALLGMIAVHTLPAQNSLTAEPTLTWSLFAGTSAALFALLAGVSLALITGREAPHTGARWRLSATSLIVRALLIFALGIGLNVIEPHVYNILPYYGLFFLLAIPFTRMRPTRLFLLAGLTAVAGPVLIHLINSGLSYEIISLPTVGSLATDPGASALSLLAGGTYPALSWMSYIFLGMGLGRLPLGRLNTQIQLLAAGGFIAVLGSVLSAFLLNVAGGWAGIRARSPLPYREILDVAAFGPADDLPMPTSSWWWLAMDGPHTNTPFSLLHSAGIAMALMAGFLLLARVAENSLTPMIAAGTMTLTLYSTHLVFITFADIETLPVLWFLLQIGAAGLVATAWHYSLGRGPLEQLVTTTSRTVSGALNRANRPAGRHHT